MLEILVALSQDPQWAIEVRAAQLQAEAEQLVDFAPGLSGAQREMCFQVAERLGAIDARRFLLDDRSTVLEARTADAYAMRPAPGEALDWHENAIALSSWVARQIAEEEAENRRHQHALMSVMLTVCRPS